jgi:hypothetical protein
LTVLSQPHLRSVPLPQPWTLLLTASVRTDGDTRSIFARRRAAQRLGEYRRALIKWLALPDPRIGSIVFVENSGANLDPLQELVLSANPFQRDVEFLGYSESRRSVVNHGYDELGSIDHAIRRSRLLTGRGRFIKASGEMFFPDLSLLLDQLPLDVEIAVDGRCGVAWLPVRLSQITTALMLLSTDFYRRELLDCRFQMTPEWGQSHAGRLLYSILSPMRSRPGVVLRFPRNAEPQSTDEHWSLTKAELLRRSTSAVRAVGRRVAPDVWL